MVVGPGGISRRPPETSTIRRVLLAVDADVLDAVWHARHATLEPSPTPGAGDQSQGLRAVAVDGKIACGAVRADGTRAAMFSMVDHADGVPLGQVEIPATGEISAFPTVLDRLDRPGVIITGDALHTQKAHVRYLHRPSGHYLFIVKANQPTLHTRVRTLPWWQVPVRHVEPANSHRRHETRTLQVISTTAPRLPCPHDRQAARITGERVQITTGEVSRETVYAVTDLPYQHAGPARLAALAPGHWTIENRVHLVRDVTYREDASRVPTGTGPRVMATHDPELAAVVDRVVHLVHSRVAGMWPDIPLHLIPAQLQRLTNVRF